LNLEVQVRANGSLQSAGRRIALFTRLIEGHSLLSLPKDRTKTTSVASKHTSAE
jgi:hypothetical protein